MRILIAEDERDMQKILALYLKKEGYEVEVASDGRAALQYLTSQSFDLVLLDWMMPIMNGIEVCHEVRKLNIPIKILMLTAKTENGHEFTGLSSGADDYLRKPFDIKILLLRIKKLCRQEDTLRCGELTVNQENYEALKQGVRLTLTKKEYELLCYFVQNQRITLTRDQILNHVWGMDYDGDARTVDTHIRRLRGKIGENYIKTCVGIGYALEDADE